MSMKINDGYNNNDSSYRTEQFERMKEKLKVQQEKEAEKGQDTGEKIGTGADPDARKGPGKMPPVRRDEYIPGERPSAPEKEDQAKQSPNAPDSPDKSKKADEKYVGNTDKVDREIEKLKERKKELEQQIRAAAGDEQKVQALEKELAQVENELRQKDNDAYRKQHCSVHKVS